MHNFHNGELGIYSKLSELGVFIFNMARTPEGLSPEVRQHLTAQNLRFSRTARAAVIAAQEAGIPHDLIESMVVDAASRAEAAGVRKIGAFGLPGPVVNGLRDETHRVRYMESLNRAK